MITGIQATAQDEKKGIDTLFGFDPFLYNGRYYTYILPRNAKGVPFLFGKDFVNGSLTIFDRTYLNLDLNYDVFNQCLLLKFDDRNGTTKIIEMSESWMDRFTIGPVKFEVIHQPGSHAVICQVIESGSVKVRYFWKKELKLDNVFGTPVYAFSRPEREQMLFVNGRALAYRKNKDFIRSFNPSVQVKISNYMKINRINVAKSSDSTISGLVNFCNNQMNP